MDSRKLVSTRQLAIMLTIDKEVEVDGIGMGVLSDGTAFLTAILDSVAEELEVLASIIADGGFKSA